jgi:small redox-active disulfide protein 2
MKGNIMKIKILGPGCANCQRLEERTKEAVEALGLDVNLEKVTDAAEIASYGIMRTPGLVVDDTVVVAGQVPSTREISDLLKN